MNTWMNNPQYLAQVGHFFGAYSLILSASLLTPHWAYVVAIGVVAAAIKEFWYDMTYELPYQTFWASFMDFGFYVLGAAVAALVIWVVV